ncbi:nmrA-like family protein [Podospora appendiculata]|uniref:NmrA-like family protein n=1 Tax=Podospora appendiculata TaxID=314037 RepID=A0AAE0X4Q6_9PEZI|nr:nmrA-like family protein [Podospora appendiculata]
MPTPYTVGIAGLTGKLARLIAHNLLQASTPSRPIHIRGLVRDLTSPNLLPASPSITLIHGTSTDLAAATAFATGCDVVLCCYLSIDDGMMLAAHKLLIDACVAARTVRRFFPADWTLDYTRLSPGDLPPKDVMLAVREYLVNSAPGVEGVHVLNGAFMDTIFSGFFGLLELDSSGDDEGVWRCWGDGEEVWELSTYASTAAFTAAAVLDESAVGVLKFLGDRKTSAEIVATLNRVYNTHIHLEHRGSLAELFATMYERRAPLKDDPSYGAYLQYMPLFYEYFCTTGLAHLGPLDALDNARYPSIKPETLEDFLRRTPLRELEVAFSKAGTVV